MPEDKKNINQGITDSQAAVGDAKSADAVVQTGIADNQKKSVYAAKSLAKKKRKDFSRPGKAQDEYEQRIVDLARVTRVMAGGKRMRFRACVALGNKNGKIGIGIDKGADVTIAVTKAVNQAKKNMIDVPIVNLTIPHEIYQKKGAAKIILKPASKGKGVIAGGTVRIILELAGVKNVTSKILGTNNKVNNAKCTLEALKNLKKTDKPKKDNKEEKIGEEEQTEKGENISSDNLEKQS
jgi:small subunit ribosomal protein S5